MVGKLRGARARVSGLLSPDTPYAEVCPDIDVYFEQVRENYAAFSNGIDYYKRCIEAISGSERIEIVPMYELAQRSKSARPRVAIRHDVDADPVVAVQLAGILAQRGICGSFFLLHSAPYYGSVNGNLFIRQSRVAGWVRQLIVSGVEVGLHNDSIGMFMRHGFDPAAVVRRELLWLRSQGAVVRGTVAHNSIAAQPAENYEIFAPQVLWERPVLNANGTRLKLGELSPASLRLEYEGTFAVPRPEINRVALGEFLDAAKSADIRDDAWMRAYLGENPICSWDIDFQCWLVGPDSWVVAGGREQSGIFHWDLQLAELIEWIFSLPDSSRTMLVVHPEYFGDYDTLRPWD